jgi:hypothetical protein
MNIAILMMHKNESELLSKWVSYHSNLVGSANLFIYDNGSTNEDAIELLEVLETKTTNIIWDFKTKADYENRGTLFCEKIKQLDKTSLYDFYMVIDCDEFLAVVDQEGNISCDPLSLQHSLSQCQNNTEVLMIDSQYYNSSISPYYFNKQPYRKCFFKKDTIQSLDQGFHMGKVTTSKDEIRTNLIHFHFHNKPYSIAKKHAKEKLTGRVSDFNIDTLKSYKGSGFHLVRFFLETEQQYLQGQISLNHIKSKSLFHKLEQLDHLWPYYQDIVKARDNLNITEEDTGFKKILPIFRGSIDYIGIEGDKIKIKGWGIVNYSRPVMKVFLEFDEHNKVQFEIIERRLREDVNTMLNVKGVILGFIAELGRKELSNLERSGTPKISTFLDSKQNFYPFDMHRKHREFNFFETTDLAE